MKLRIALIFLLFSSVCASANATDSLAVDSLSHLPFYKIGFIGKVYRYFEESNEPRRDKKFDISFIGGPHYSSNEGFGIGIAGSGSYNAGGINDTVTPMSNVMLKGDITTGRLFKIGAEGYHIFANDRYRINYDGYFYTFRDCWWGIGYAQNSNDVNECWYNRLQGFLSLDFVFKIKNKFYVGPRGTFTYIKGYKFENPDLLGDYRPRTFTMGLGATAYVDTRDVPTCATHGNYFRIDVQTCPRFLANKYRFTMAEGRYSHYRQVWKGGVLAGNIHTRFTWGNPPWSMLSTFGGSHQMRAYWEGRYRDKMETDICLELRQHVWRRNGIVVWAGAGTVYPRFSAIRLHEVLPEVGLGYRWEFKKGVNVRLDCGIGRGEKSFCFSLNEAF